MARPSDECVCVSMWCLSQNKILFCRWESISLWRHSSMRWHCKTWVWIFSSYGMPTWVDLWSMTSLLLCIRIDPYRWCFGSVSDLWKSRIDFWKWWKWLDLTWLDLSSLVIRFQLFRFQLFRFQLFRFHSSLSFNK